MTRTILLADDSLTIRKVVELAFADTDIRVESVESGREALERLDAIKPDLILADVVMPGPTGYEICERIKTSSHPVPVLLLAGTFEPFDPDRARDCGADGHLVKPFESRTLVERVETLLARGPVPLPARPERPEEEELEAVLDDLAARDASSGPPAGSGLAAVELEEALAGAPEGIPAGAPGTGDAELAAGHVPTPAWAIEAAGAGVAPAAASPGTPEPPEALAPAGWPQLSEEETDAIARALLEQAGGVDAIARAIVDQLGGVDAIARAALLRLGGVEAIARPIVERLGGEALREVAWEVVPDLAEVLIRERLREIEREERGRD